MDRRHFLELSTTGMLAFSIPYADWLADPHNAALLAAPRLLDTLGAETVRTIGERYRMAFPHENHPGVLQTAILNADEPEPQGTKPDFRRRVREEFELGHTVTVDGWILSVTEARQSALYSLLTSS